MRLKTTWMVQNGEYCLFVDDEKVDLLCFRINESNKYLRLWIYIL